MKLTAIVFAIILCVCCSDVVSESQFKIVTKRDNDTVEVKVVRDEAVISVRSPFGISQATIDRGNEKWPNIVVMQLHLKGLENFKVTNGSITLEAAVSSHDGKVRLWKDGKVDSLLDAESPYWMEIRIIGNNDKPVQAIPLEDGYFDLQLPKAFFEDNPKTITGNWIDFYR